MTYVRGLGKGERAGTSTGKGFGRRLNPIGRDGQVRKCSICNHEFHNCKDCPQRTDNHPCPHCDFPLQTVPASQPSGRTHHVPDYRAGLRALLKD